MVAWTGLRYIAEEHQFVGKTDANALKIAFKVAPPTDRTAFETYIEASAHRKV